MNLVNFATAITVWGLVMTSPTPVDEDDKFADALLEQHGYSCYDVHRVYDHGAIFTVGSDRCIKYICNDGSYDIYEEGCDQWGHCWPVDKVFDYECRQYTCQASFVVGGFSTYQIRPLSVQGCQDRFNQCKRPGEVFEYVKDGQVKKYCSCLPIGSANTTYFCYD